MLRLQPCRSVSLTWLVSLFACAAIGCSGCSGGAGEGGTGGGGGGTGGGGGAGGGGTGGGAGVHHGDYDDLPHRFAAAECRRLFDCALTWPEEAELRELLVDEATCVEALADPMPEVESALAAGTASLDEAALEACLDAASTICDRDQYGYGGRFMAAVCAYVFVGTIDAGEPCAQSRECASGGTCLIDPGDGCGTCQRSRAALGESCDAWVGCEPSALGPVDCGLDGPLADAPTCHVIESPAFAGPGEDCLGEGVVCQVGLYCDGVCREPRVEGSSCDSSDACVRGTACEEDADGNRACRAIEVVTAEGGACDEGGTPPILCSFAEGLVCDPASKKCIRPGSGAAGSNCASEWPDASVCDEGLACSGSDVFVSDYGVCRVPAENGSACNLDRDCASRHCVYDQYEDTGTCRAVSTAGSCAASLDCSLGAGAGAPYTLTVEWFETRNESGMGGFDLDGVENACGVSDYGSSIDNSFPANLLDDAAKVVGTASTFDEAILAALAGGTLAIHLTIEGDSGAPDDPCVLVDLDFNGAVVADAQGYVEDDVLTVPSLGVFRMSLPVVEGFPVELDAYGARLRYDLATGFGALGGMIPRGGLDYAYASETSEGTLHRVAHDVAALLAPSDPATFDVVMDAILDQVSDSTAPVGPACSAVSFGFPFSTGY